MQVATAITFQKGTTNTALTTPRASPLNYNKSVYSPKYKNKF